MAFPPLTWKETCPGGDEWEGTVCHRSNASPPTQPLGWGFRLPPSPGCAWSWLRSSSGSGQPHQPHHPAPLAPVGGESRLPQDAALLRLHYPALCKQTQPRETLPTGNSWKQGPVPTCAATTAGSAEKVWYLKGMRTVSLGRK